MYRNNTFKIVETTWDKDFGLSDGFYSISDIQGYFKYINKRHETLTDNSPVEIYFNRSQNKFIFKIKSGYYVELFLPKIMNVLDSTEEKITKDKNGDNVPHLENIEVVLLHFQHDYGSFCIFSK